MKRTKRWTTRDGTKVRICDMEDGHLLNTIHFLQRNHARIVGSYLLGPGPQGEAAQDCFDQEFDALDEDGPSATHPLYDELVAEANERRILDDEQERDYQLAADCAMLGAVAKVKRASERGR